jgi:hypothetical protein
MLSGDDSAAERFSKLSLFGRAVLDAAVVPLAPDRFATIHWMNARASAGVEPSPPG